MYFFFLHNPNSEEEFMQLLYQCIMSTTGCKFILQTPERLGFFFHLIRVDLNQYFFLLWYGLLENPWENDTMSVEEDWAYPTTSFEKLRYAVFKDLWEKGFYLTSGQKFGGDFLAYPGNINL